MPTGYRDFVTRLGEGYLGDHFLEILSPREIFDRFDAWQQGFAQYWFWGKTQELVTAEQGPQCVPMPSETAIIRWL